MPLIEGVGEICASLLSGGAKAVEHGQVMGSRVLIVKHGCFIADHRANTSEAEAIEAVDETQLSHHGAAPAQAVKTMIWHRDASIGPRTS
jgi:hypothetical protein